MKTKFDASLAMPVAQELLSKIEPFTHRCVIAGSLRRGRPLVGDIELVFVPKLAHGKPVDLFIPPPKISKVDIALEELLRLGLLAKRPNVKGSFTWGDSIKLAVHLPSGIPVDFFATIETSWFNYLVCRTGSAETNMRIATAAQAKGLKWHPFNQGFTDRCGHWLHVESEQQVFEIAGLPYLEPTAR